MRSARASARGRPNDSKRDANCPRQAWNRRNAKPGTFSKKTAFGPSLDELQRKGKEIAVVGGPQLLARHWARGVGRAPQSKAAPTSELAPPGIRTGMLDRTRIAIRKGPGIRTGRCS